jgi:phage terminase Nu1 subunit (DNA packaging protein)
MSSGDRVSIEHVGPEPWRSRVELAEHLGISVRTIDRLVGEGMPCLAVGQAGSPGHKRFRVSEVERWLEERGGEAA